MLLLHHFRYTCHHRCHSVLSTVNIHTNPRSRKVSYEKYCIKGLKADFIIKAYLYKICRVLGMCSFPDDMYCSSCWQRSPCQKGLVLLGWGCTAAGNLGVDFEGFRWRRNTSIDNGMLQSHQEEKAINQKSECTKAAVLVKRGLYPSVNICISLCALIQ